MTLTKILLRIIVNILGTLPIYGVVCQMHTQLLYVFGGRFLILLRCKANQSLVEDVYSKGRTTGDQGVDSKVELEVFVEKRVLEVGLHNLFFGLEIYLLLPEVDPLSLAAYFRLYDEGRPLAPDLAPVLVLVEDEDVLREQEGQREEGV